MSALAVYRSDEKMHGAARGSASHLGFGSRASVNHHEFQRAIPPSRTTGRGLTRSGPSIRAGWAGDVNVLAAIRRLVASGIDAQVAACVATDHPCAPGHFQCFPERNSHSSKPFRQPVLDADDANENGLTDAQILFAPGAKAND